MLYDVRTYTCKPGGVAKQFEVYVEKGKAAQVRHLGAPVFYGVTETGTVNSYLHIWAYENAADREQRRAAMEADPDWQEFKKAGAELGVLIRQENCLMTNAPFFGDAQRLSDK